MSANIMIAGRGPMAKVLASTCRLDGRSFHSFKYGRNDFDGEYDNLVAIHFGSEKELSHLVQWCQLHGVPLIQGSTGQKHQEASVPMVYAPNLSLYVVRLIQKLPGIKESLGDDVDIDILESHQRGKKKISGTALLIANLLNIPEEDIESIRDESNQLALGIPDRYLNAHAYHWIHFVGQKLETTQLIAVNGRDDYARGALAIADILVQHREELEARLYDVTEVLSLAS